MEERDTSEIIKRIKERRIMQNLSYQDLADKTGISKSTLQRYETGFIKNLPIDKLEILANALNTTPGYLMGWEIDSPSSSLEYKTIKNPEDAMTFILKQPTLMAYGGYDIKKMTNDDLVDFANELLRQLELISYKYKK
jgi:transcriptional regulator with XRE-family HTH domain